MFKLVLMVIVALLFILFFQAIFLSHVSIEPIIELKDTITKKPPIIEVSYPKSDDIISSPFTITGKAKGNWFFEATAPVVLVDWDGLIIAQGFIQTKENWMTENFVQFEGILEFNKPEMASTTDFGKIGTLILKKDNPSGLPQNDYSIEIPVRFK